MFVAAQFLARQIGDDFFVRRAEAEITLVAILDLQHLRAEHRPASGFLPEFRGLHGGHQQFDGASPVHFFAHDGFHFAQDAQTQRHPGVQAGAEAFDQAGTQHQAMTGQFGFGRGFFAGGEEEL